MAGSRDQRRLWISPRAHESGSAHSQREVIGLMSQPRSLAKSQMKTYSENLRLGFSGQSRRFRSWPRYVLIECPSPSEPRSLFQVCSPVCGSPGDRAEASSNTGGRAPQYVTWEVKLPPPKEMANVASSRKTFGRRRLRDDRKGNSSAALRTSG